MGIFSRKKDDESLIEISNDDGDHIVVNVPTREVKGIERDLRNAGCVYDHDEHRKNEYGYDRVIANRDHSQHRYRSTRVVDEYEDFEDTNDHEVEEIEADYADLEPDGDDEYNEQSVNPWWKVW